MCDCVCESSFHGVQKRASDALECKIQVVVRCFQLVLGTELRSSRRASLQPHFHALFTKESKADTKGESLCLRQELTVHNLQCVFLIVCIHFLGLL